MATKKKTKKTAKKKPSQAAKKSQKTGAKKSAAKKPAVKKLAPKGSRAAKKSLVAKPAARKIGKPAAKNSKPVSTRGKREITESVEFEAAGLGARSGGQSGALQGLSNRAGADSESVDELLEEGNAFEAEVIKGVEDVPDADEREIHTHEVPEDDVPGEYDDEERPGR
jgi:hypothetical protein